jgi:hypothetical protein
MCDLGMLEKKKWMSFTREFSKWCYSFAVQFQSWICFPNAVSVCAVSLSRGMIRRTWRRNLILGADIYIYICICICIYIYVYIYMFTVSICAPHLGLMMLGTSMEGRLIGTDRCSWDPHFHCSCIRDVAIYAAWLIHSLAIYITGYGLKIIRAWGREDNSRACFIYAGYWFCMPLRFKYS